MVKEEDIAGAVVTYLEQQGWNVYQEVEYVGGRADIVATRGLLIRVVEVKTSFTAAVVEQAWRWKPWAHYVHIAIPRLKVGHRIPGRAVLYSFCLSQGIGIFQVYDAKYRKCQWEIVEQEEAKLNRKALARKFRDALRSEHKHWGKAGNAENKYFTPWKGTCEAWRVYITQHQGCSIKELVENAGHHYFSDSSARSCMTKYLRQGIIPGVEVCRGKGNRIELYPKAEEKPRQKPKQTGRGRRPKEQQ